MISINYNDKDYELCILETKPRDAVSIIECDMDVDFAAPVGYEEPVRKKESSTSKATSGRAAQLKEKSKPTFHPGYRLDGKPAKHIDIPTTSSNDKLSRDSISSSLGSSYKQETNVMPRGIPNYDYKVGTIVFHHDFDEDEEMVLFVNFMKKHFHHYDQNINLKLFIF